MKPLPRKMIAVAALAVADLAALMLMSLTEWASANLFLVCGVLAERLLIRA